MATATELLNLTVPRRIEGARFDLLDQHNTTIGRITPRRVVSIENRSQGVLKRTVTNFVLTPDVAADVNPLTDRVKAWWRLGGVEYPLGVFLFASWSANRQSYGLIAATRLLDQGVILGQNIPNSVGFNRGVLVRDALASVFSAAGIFSYSIDPANTVVVDNLLGWAPSPSNTYARIATYLCSLAGLSDWYFDNDGALVVPPRPNVALEATLRYDAGRNIIAGSPIEQSDLLNAPNRYIAIDTANRGAPAWGSYDLPNAAPNSIANRGFPITRVIEAPGTGSFTAAAAFAETYAKTDPKAFETVTFSGPPDPRHDTYDVVSYLGVNYEELGWRLACAPGGPHEHTIRRTSYT